MNEWMDGGCTWVVGWMNGRMDSWWVGGRIVGR